MFGFGKKKDEEMKEVKEAVAPSTPLVTRPQETPELNRIELPSVNEPKQFAPLYIKVEKYREVLQKVQKLKALINNINALAVLQDDIAKIREDASIALKKNIEDFSNTATALDQELVRPQFFEPYVKDTTTQNVEGYTDQLREEVSKMKEQLEKF